MSSEPDFANSLEALRWMLGPLAAVTIAALVAWPLSYGAPKHATSDFYIAAADIGVVVLIALAIEARLFTLRAIPRVKLVKPTKRLTNKVARRTWATVYVLQALIAVGVILSVERSIMLTLARGNYAHASAQGVFSGLVFGLVAVVVAGLMLPSDPHDP